MGSNSLVRQVGRLVGPLLPSWTGVVRDVREQERFRRNPFFRLKRRNGLEVEGSRFRVEALRRQGVEALGH